MHTKRLHFPVSILKYDGGLIVGAAKAHPEVLARLEPDYVTETETLLDTLRGDVVTQYQDRGQLGVLTKAQEKSLLDLQHLMGQARRTAKLAFPGQTVKLHEQFQVGVQNSFELPDVLQRADIIIASVKDAANLPLLKKRGWADVDTKAFDEARSAFGTPEEEQEKMKTQILQAVGTKNTDALAAYERVQTIQNAANLQFPATDPANAPVRAEFRFGIFPPDHHTAEPPTPTPTPTPPNP